jgi:Flp pilus assembly protein TadG
MNTTTSSEGPPRKLFAQVMSGFARAEDGAVLVFGLIIFVLMLMVSGLAVDVMRYENDRVRLQGTSDRAVLAATSLMNSNVTMTPQELAQAYFDAEGLGEFASGNITVTDTSETGRTVRVNPTARMETMFLRMSGINNLDMTAPAAAVEGRGGTTKVEIVMVLDASGSMGSSTSTGRTRLAEMKLAAKSFAAEILGNNDPANVSLSLVTYDSWVLPTPGMLNHMLDVSGSGACLEFDDWTDVRDGNGPPPHSNAGGNGNGGIGVGVGLGVGGIGVGVGVGVGNGNGPPWASVGQNSSNAPGTRVNCSTNAAYEIKPMVNDLADFESYVDAISTRGTTSIDLGARFGAMLLDPDMRGFIDSMVDSGQLPAEMRGRPFDWDEPGVHRVMVLLTDGQNCCGSRFNSSVQDDNTLAVCQGMRANDVTVYTVSFDAPQGAIDLLSECASSENHFFNTGGDALVASFDSIATHVQTQTLRLTE